MKYFLVVYNRRTGTLNQLVEFAADERAAAFQARFHLEAMARDEPDLEVIVLGASSRETLQKTHRRYFETVEELVASV